MVSHPFHTEREMDGMVWLATDGWGAEILYSLGENALGWFAEYLLETRSRVFFVVAGSRSLACG